MQIKAAAAVEADPLKYLQQFINDPTNGSDPVLLDAIIQIRNEIESKMALAASSSSQESSDSLKAETIIQLAKSQEEAIGLMSYLVKLPGAKAWDESGKEIANVADLVIEKGKPIEFSKLIIPLKKRTVAIEERMLKPLEDVFENFAALGVKVKKQTFGAENRCTGKGSFMCCFAIEVPKGYKGNMHPMTMDEGQIEEFLAALKKTPEREVRGNAAGFGTEKSMEELGSSYREFKDQFRKELNTPAPGPTRSSISPSFSAKQMAVPDGMDSVCNFGRGGSAGSGVF